MGCVDALAFILLFGAALDAAVDSEPQAVKAKIARPRAPPRAAWQMADILQTPSLVADPIALAIE